MIFEKQIGVKLHVSASVGAIILILTGVISEKEALRSIDLKTVFLFGGSLALASALETTGAGTAVSGGDGGAVRILAVHPHRQILLCRHACRHPVSLVQE